MENAVVNPYEKIKKFFPVGTCVNYLGKTMSVTKVTDVPEIEVVLEYFDNDGKLQESHYSEDNLNLFGTAIMKAYY